MKLQRTAIAIAGTAAVFVGGIVSPHAIAQEATTQMQDPLSTLSWPTARVVPGSTVQIAPNGTFPTNVRLEGEDENVGYRLTTNPRTGIVTVKKGELTEDDVLMAVLDAGADEVNDLGEEFEIICKPTDLTAVKEALTAEGIEVEDSEQEFRADVEVDLDAEGAKKMMRLIDALEESDDVQNVYTNMTFSDEVAAQLDD